MPGLAGSICRSRRWTAAGIAPDHARWPCSPNRSLDAAARWLAAKAEHHFTEAHAILAAKPKGHLIAPRLMDAAYSRILRKLMAQGWQLPRTRVRTNKPLLALTLLRLWLTG